MYCLFLFRVLVLEAEEFVDGAVEAEAEELVLVLGFMMVVVLFVVF